jgi:hypothetical protein
VKYKRVQCAEHVALVGVGSNAYGTLVGNRRLLLTWLFGKYENEAEWGVHDNSGLLGYGVLLIVKQLLTTRLFFDSLSLEDEGSTLNLTWHHVPEHKSVGL